MDLQLHNVRREPKSSRRHWRTSAAIWALGIAGFAAVVASHARGDEAWPAALTRFRSAAGPALFNGGGPGQWDARIRERGWILRDEDRWHLWYTGYDGSREGIRRLGYATSSDGLTWQRQSAAPLVADQWIEDVCVIRDGRRLVMFAEGLRDRAQLWISPNGDPQQWEHQGPVRIIQVNGRPIPDGPYGTPTAWLEDGVWSLLYERRDLGIWLARSSDLKTFEQVQDEPVLRPGPGLYDRDLIAINQVVRHGDRYYAIYHGAADDSTPKLWSTAIARSRDLIHWEKYDGNPLLPRELNRSSGQLVPITEGYRLYTMHPEVHAHEPE